MTYAELAALRALADRDESAVPLCGEYRQAITTLLAEVARLRADLDGVYAKLVISQAEADDLRDEVHELSDRLSEADPDVVWID